jgi:hypothetical protein
MRMMLKDELLRIYPEAGPGPVAAQH